MLNVRPYIGYNLICPFEKKNSGIPNPIVVWDLLETYCKDYVGKSKKYINQGIMDTNKNLSRMTFKFLKSYL